MNVRQKCNYFFVILGEGAFGVSNSLGANTMAILFSLGMPWFFKTMLDGANTDNPIKIQSGSIEYTIIALIFVAFALYTTLALNKFRLSKLTGGILICIFVLMVALAVVSEMVFFPTDECWWRCVLVNLLTFNSRVCDISSSTKCWYCIY